MTRRKMAFAPENLPRWRDLYVAAAMVESTAVGGRLGELLHGAALGLRSGDLWWVRKDMTRLAVEAAQTLGDYASIYTEFMPAPSGVVVWQGGTGLMSGKGEVVGAVWMHVPGTDVAVIPQVRGRDSMMSTLDSGALGVASIEKVSHDTAKLVAATWLLATSPGVTDEHTINEAGERVSTGADAGTDGERRRTARPREIKVAYLREVPRVSAPVAGAEPKWKVGHAFVVRGHWRNQAFGPGRTQRRPTWIQAHVRGQGEVRPEAPLVHIWRR